MSVKDSSNFIPQFSLTLRIRILWIKNSVFFPIAEFGINSKPNIKFNNFISIGSNTISSLTRTLSLTDNDYNYQLNNNIVNLAEKIGYETFWVSNQGQIGKFDSPNAIVGKSSDHYYFLKKGDSDEKGISDNLLLPKFKDYLNYKTAKPKFIVIHMFGSHPYACDRTNGQFDEYILSDNLSCYSKTIKDLDEFIKFVYQSLEEKNKPFKIVYFSDHGLRITDDLNIYHGTQFKQSFEVPLLIWDSHLKKNEVFNNYRNSRDFLHLFSELNGIKTKNIKNNYTFLSEEDSQINPFIVLGENNLPQDYEKLKENNIQEYEN